MKLSDLKPGDRLRCDDGFTCIPPNAVRVVRGDDEGLFIRCRGAEDCPGWDNHYLAGQVGKGGVLIGVRVVGR